MKFNMSTEFQWFELEEFGFGEQASHLLLLKASSYLWRDVLQVEKTTWRIGMKVKKKKQTMS